MRPSWRCSRVVWPVLLFCSTACGRTELETRPWHDYDSGPPWQQVDAPDVVPDVAPEVEPEVEPEAEADVPPDAPPDAPPDEFVGLSCMSAAMCALCCPTTDFGCQMGCVSAADPSSSGALTGIVACAATSGCGADLTCLMDTCSAQLDACNGGPGGTGGCLSLAWCLVSSGCGSVAACEDRGTCYQTCFGAARPGAMGAARDLVICIAGTCLTSCTGGLTSTACLSCMGSNCLATLRGCIGL